MKALSDKRIIVLDEEDVNISTFSSFVTNVLPDLLDEDDTLMITETMQTLFPLLQEKESEPVVSKLNTKGQC